jgi:phosphoribosylglycinamide formyltransferase-1
MDRSLLVLASGTGSLAQAIIEATQNGEISAQVLAVLTDKPDAEVVSKCATLGVPIITHPLQDDRKIWNEEMYLITESLNPSLVVSAGFMRILAPDYVSDFKVINSHPSLLPNFPGAHAVRDALSAKAESTGTTIHWVDAGMDTGKVIASAEVPILNDDTEELLHERIKIVERGLIVATISQVLDSLETSHG